ncbi:MAG: hypothetical protein CBC22_03940 [Alphaproteobacteria bacterium TMED62]|nr:MAG: hypothetical protein CBC22_03940 [Alphaproteobacteria bacterium TMED62]|tara:strand:- start:6877 stop:7572 length:696 start_codon:yes stop_codon:yes gene_type:complete
MKRTHDEFYLSENNKSVKQVFVEVANIIEQGEFSSIADVGCATGAFPNYLKFRFPDANVIGIEYLESLLNKASKDFSNISFIKGNVLDRDSIKDKYDVVTMCGVLSIFDDYCHALDNVLSWVKPKGKLILHNMISEYDIDVFVKYKPSSLKVDYNELESGWNIISKKSLKLVAEKNNASLTLCKSFTLKVNLDKQKDIMRSWTEENISGEKDIFNALHIRQPHKIAVIEKL